MSNLHLDLSLYSTSGGGIVMPASAVFDLDATQIGSYPGSGQVWNNLIATPADGSAQSAYNFNLGATASASTDDPTFVGTAGAPSAYFGLDGGDYFELSTGNTTFTKSLHKTTDFRPFTMIVCFRAADGVTSRVIMGNTAKSASTAHGIRLNIDSGENTRLFQGDGTVAKASPNGYNVPVGADVFLAAAFDGAVSRSWGNSAVASEAAYTYNADSTDAPNPFNIGYFLPSGTRIYAASLFNASLSNADVAKVISVYNTRHGRTYA